MQHTDPSVNTKFNNKRHDWIGTLAQEHLEVLELCSDTGYELNFPETLRKLSKQIIVNLYKHSSKTRAMIKELVIYESLQEELNPG